MGETRTRRQHILDVVEGLVDGLLFDGEEAEELPVDEGLRTLVSATVVHR